jgi:hypothetical protein
VRLGFHTGMGWGYYAGVGWWEGVFANVVRGCL